MTLWQFFLGMIWITWGVTIMIIAWVVICLPIIVGYGIYRFLRWWHENV